MSKRIMFIDDAKIIRQSVALFLQETQYEIFFVDDGFSALGEIYSKRPDLIFIDLLMPKLGGYEVCQMVKQHPDFADIPIVILSSKDGLFDRVRGKLVGANDYLTKPFTKTKLLETIGQFLTAST